MWKIYTYIILHISIQLSYPQIDNDFLYDLKISINDSTFIPDSIFTKEILSKAENGKINYTICGMAFSNHMARTRVKIPQTFDQDNVIRQCVLYFYLLNNNEDRNREYLEVYPFFEPLTNRPYVIVRYQNDGILKINFREWDIIQVPSKPTSIEAEIYNQVIELSYHKISVFDTVDVKIFEKVAIKNDLNVSIVINIYKKVLLWQKSQ